MISSQPHTMQMALIDSFTNSLMRQAQLIKACGYICRITEYLTSLHKRLLMEWTSVYSPSKEEEKQEGKLLCSVSGSPSHSRRAHTYSPTGIFLESFLNEIDYGS